MSTNYFIEPLDVLSVRGNRAFGESGEFGEMRMPPWPSLFAGAIRSAMLGRDSAALAAFGPNMQQLPGALGEVLGTPERPGTFKLEWASLGRRVVEGTEEIYEPLLPLPADLMVLDGHPTNAYPHVLPASLRSSCPLPKVPVFRSRTQSKPKGGYWLGGRALTQYLNGRLPESTDLIESDDIMKRERRIGIALANKARTVEEGALFSLETMAFTTGYGFITSIAAGDHGDALLPDGSLLRLGGDGRGARCNIINFITPTTDLGKIANEGRFRLLLLSPGIFCSGWIPDAVAEDGRLRGNGFDAKLICAAVARSEVVSGWDLARWAPKPAQRVAPQGCVYWFEDFNGDPNKLAEWVSAGLWGENIDEQRRAEGFNRALLAAWPQEG